MIKKIPDVGYATHIYCEENGIQFENSNGHALTYRCNSLWDPQYGVGGHQPALRDNMAQLYERYQVMRAKIEWWVQPRFNAAHGGFVWTEKLIGDVNDGGTALSNIQVMESGTRQWWDVGYTPGSTGAGQGDTRNSWHKFTQTYSDKELARLTSVKDRSALSGVDPTGVACFQLVGRPLLYVDALSNLYVKVRITYEAKWTQPLLQPTN